MPKNLVSGLFVVEVGEEIGLKKQKKGKFMQLSLSGAGDRSRTYMPRGARS